MRKLIFDVIRLSLVLTFVFQSLFYPLIMVNAETKANNLKELRAELDALKKEKADMEKEKALTQSEINAKHAARENAYNEKEKIANQVKDLEEEIVLSEGKIERLLNETNDLMRFLEISEGNSIYLEYIASSSSITDLIVRTAVIEQLTKYNEEVTTNLKDLIAKNENLKEELNIRNIELDEKIVSYGNSLSALGKKLYEMNDINEDIDSQIKNQNELIKYYAGICTSETQKLSDCVSIMASTGWIRPLVSGKVTSEWGYRTMNGVTSFHNALDIGGNKEGTNVYSPANGLVVAITVRSSCGGNIVYIHHNVSGKAYTTQYAHLLNYNVKVGDKVTTSSVIGTVGGGTTKSYDKCTTGPHLHFGMSKGHYLGGGSSGYSSWSTFLANSIVPIGYTNKYGYSWTKRS